MARVFRNRTENGCVIGNLARKSFPLCQPCDGVGRGDALRNARSESKYSFAAIERIPHVPGDPIMVGRISGMLKFTLQCDIAFESKNADSRWLDSLSPDLCWADRIAPGRPPSGLLFPNEAGQPVDLALLENA